MAALALMLVAGNASAEENVSVTTNGSTVNVSGLAETDFVSVKVMPKDADESDISYLYEIKEIEVTSEDGSYSYSFEMPGKFDGADVDGEFTVYALGAEKKTYNFEFISESKRESFIASLNTEDLKMIFDNDANARYFNAFGVYVSFYSSLMETEKENFVMFLKNELGEEKITAENISDLVKIAYVLERAQKNIDENLLAEAGVKFEEKTIIEETDAEKKAWFVKYLNEKKPYADSDAMQSAYTDAGVLYILQTAKYTDYDAIIEKYNAQINIKNTPYYQKYAAMSDVNKNKVRETVKLSASSFTNYQAFLDGFQDAVNSVNNSNSNNSGGGSGSGGSGSGGSGNGTSKVTISPSVVDQVIKQNGVKKFSDVAESHWAKDAVEALASKNIISGYEDDTFKPNSYITREEFVKIIVVALDLDKTSRKNVFTDVDDYKWYAEYIDTAVAKGLISGRADGTFGIGEKITREEMAVIVRRAINEIISMRNYVEFNDMDDIAEFAREAVKDLYCAGIINGLTESEFSPKSFVTRAQTAKVIYDAFIK